jgi:hypothetical protein
MLTGMREKSMQEEKDAERRFLAAARDLWPAAKGSLARVARPCGRPKQCAACLSGQRHPMWIFTFRRDGRLRCRYVPQDLVPALRRALANGRQLEKRLTEEGAGLIERFRRARSSRKALE